MKRILIPTTLSCCFGLSGTSVLADTAAITSNQVSFSATGFNATKTIQSNGLLDSAVANVPAASINNVNGLVVSWSFSPVSADPVTDGTYVFDVGMVVDQDGANRRLEILIPNVSLTFSGNNLTGGSVSANTGTSVYGRANDSVTNVNTTINNSAFTITNNSLSINLGNQLNKIGGAGSILNDLITTFSTTAPGHYNFAVMMKQKSTTATGKFLNFGLTDGTKLPCVNTNVFVIGGNAANNAAIQGAAAIQGEFSINGVGGTNTDAVTAFTGTCASSTPTTTNTNTGGGTTTTPPDSGPVITGNLAESARNLSTLTTTLENDLRGVALGSVNFNDPNDPVARRLASNVQNAIQLIDLALTRFESGDEIDDETRDLVEATFDTVLRTQQQARQIDDDYALTDITQTVEKASDYFKGAVNSRSVTAQRRYLSRAKSLVNSIRSLFSSLTGLSALSNISQGVDGQARTLSAVSVEAGNLDAVKSFIESTGGIVTAVTSNGEAVDQALYGDLQAISESAVEASLEPLAKKNGVAIPADATESEIAAILKANPALLYDVLAHSALSIGSTTFFDTDNARQLLEGAGVNAADAQSLAEQFTLFLDPDNATVPVREGLALRTQTAAESLLTVLDTAGTSLAWDDETGLLTVSVSGIRIPVNVVDVAVVAGAIPEGLYFIENGSALAVANGLAVNVVPGALDPKGFAAGLADVNTRLSADTDGSIEINGFEGGALFTGTFSFGGYAAGSGLATIEPPDLTLDPADPAFNYRVSYADGGSQTLQPYIADEAFFDSLDSLSLKVSVNRRTGIVTVNGLKFRPDYFIVGRNLSDHTFYLDKQDASGVAYRRVDANGDGITDYEILSARGKQVVYGIP